MAQDPSSRYSRLVTFAANARRDLATAHDSTAEQWGDEQADAYSKFLLDTAQHLANEPATAPLLPNYAGVRVYVARWKNARQGHRIFFEETPDGINVLRVTHTQMNWKAQLGQV